MSSDKLVVCQGLFETVTFHTLVEVHGDVTVQSMFSADEAVFTSGSLVSKTLSATSCTLTSTDFSLESNTLSCTSLKKDGQSLRFINYKSTNVQVKDPFLRVDGDVRVCHPNTNSLDTPRQTTTLTIHPTAATFPQERSPLTSRKLLLVLQPLHHSLTLSLRRSPALGVTSFSRASPTLRWPSHLSLRVSLSSPSFH